MGMAHEDARRAGRLIQWGLRPKALPFNEPEYRELLRQYEDRPEFRALVDGCAEGLGLSVLLASERGLFLGPEDASVFAQSPSDFRGRPVSGDDRLLDGLVQLGIAATVFPRQRDLDDDILEARPPVSSADVDETIRGLAEALKQQAAASPEDQIDRGLREAWQVYESLSHARRTKDGKLAKRSALGRIEVHLDRLAEFGCFTAERQRTPVHYRPTLRYQVFVQELAATKLHQRVQAALDARGAEAAASGEAPQGGGEGGHA